MKKLKLSERETVKITYCKINGCLVILEKGKTSFGMCRKHYMRIRRHGHTYDTMRPKGTGTITRYGYLAIKINGENKLAHRHIMEQFLARKLSKDEVVHHLDGNKLNNDISNLKILTPQEHNGLNFLGRRHSKETLNKMRQKALKRWKNVSERMIQSERIRRICNAKRIEREGNNACH